MIDKLFPAFVPFETRSRFSSTVMLLEAQILVAKRLQEVLIAQNKTAAALEISEWGRARLFLELIATRQIPKASPQEAQQVTRQTVEAIAKQTCISVSCRASKLHDDSCEALSVRLL
jgi:hypothetical protein